MSTDIPVTHTKESQALENAMSGMVHDIPAPGPCWVTVEVKGGKAYCFNLNDAPSAFVVLTILKDNKSVKITHREAWQ